MFHGVIYKHNQTRLSEVVNGHVEILTPTRLLKSSKSAKVDRSQKQVLSREVYKMAKKVWVLERYIDSAEMAKTLEELKEHAAEAEKEGDVASAAFKDAVIRYQEKMEQHTDGYWLGHVGRSNYKQFCWDAKRSLKFWLREKCKKVDELRVVEGYIEDNSKTWAGYTVTKVNNGVKRYLLATM